MKTVGSFLNSGGNKLEFPLLLSKIQEYMPNAYSNVMATDSSQRKFDMESMITKYLNDNQYSMDGLSTKDLVEKLYNEMAGFGFLTPYLNLSIKGIESIEIHSWDCVKIKRIGSKLERIEEHFLSPQHAYDIIKRILNETKITMDDAKPLVRSHLGDKIRITVIGGGSVLDKDAGIAVSIRFVNPSDLTGDDLIRFGTLTPDMLDFLCTVYQYGASLMFSGETDAGKTTLMSIIMRTVKKDKILITIENGPREFNLVVRDEEGLPINSVIHLATRESTNSSNSITPQMLLEQSMTMNPDYLCMAEVRGSEAYETIEAALTGHPVIGTTHADGCKGIPDRLMQLASIKGGNMRDSTLYSLVVKAFPILFYAIKGKDGVRRVTEICECLMKDGNPVCKPLWEFISEGNYVQDEKIIVKGHYEKVGTISEPLQKKLRLKNIPEEKLQEFLKMKGESPIDSHRIDRIPRHDGGRTDSAETVAV